MVFKEWHVLPTGYACFFACLQAREPQLWNVSKTCANDAQLGQPEKVLRDIVHSLQRYCKKTCEAKLIYSTVKWWRMRSDASGCQQERLTFCPMPNMQPQCAPHHAVSSHIHPCASSSTCAILIYKGWHCPWVKLINKLNYVNIWYMYVCMYMHACKCK